LPNDITQSALSQHLALLKAHRILDFKKIGQNITYSIADRRVEKIVNVLKKNYCDESRIPERKKDDRKKSHHFA
jgi:DNA-binding transcriptional ArsR family regulator